MPFLYRTVSFQKHLFFSVYVDRRLILWRRRYSESGSEEIISFVFGILWTKEIFWGGGGYWKTKTIFGSLYFQRCRIFVPSIKFCNLKGFFFMDWFILYSIEFVRAIKWNIRLPVNLRRNYYFFLFSTF